MVKTAADHVKAEPAANFRRPRIQRSWQTPSLEGWNASSTYRRIKHLRQKFPNSANSEIILSNRESRRPEQGAEPTVLKVIREPPGNPEALYPIGTIRNLDLVAKSGQCRIALPRLRSREWSPCSCSCTLLVTLGPDRVAGWMVKSRADRIKSDVSGPAPRDLGFSPEGGDPSAASVYGRYKGITGQSLSDVVDSHAIGSMMQDAGEKLDDRGSVR